MVHAAGSVPYWASFVLPVALKKTVACFAYKAEPVQQVLQSKVPAQLALPVCLSNLPSEFPFRLAFSVCLSILPFQFAFPACHSACPLMPVLLPFEFAFPICLWCCLSSCSFSLTCNLPFQFTFHFPLSAFPVGPTNFPFQFAFPLRWLPLLNLKQWIAINSCTMRSHMRSQGPVEDCPSMGML